jgi:ABC-type transporter Mla MlaB component
MLEAISEGHYKLTGVLDIQHADDLPALLALGKSGLHHLEIDCSGVESSDSLLLSVILSLARSFEAHEGTFSIIHFPERLSGLASTYGIDSLIKPYCSQ